MAIFDYTVALEFGKNIFGGIAKGIIFGIVIGTAAGLGYLVNRLRKFNHIVRVYEKDGAGNIIEKEPSDRGGIFIDKKTKYRLFLLRRNKIGLTPDKIPFMLTSKGKKVVYLMQTGLRNFQYMGSPTITANPRLSFDIQDEDVAWGLNAWEKFRMPTKHDLLKQFLPYIGLAIFGMFIIVMIYLILDKGSVMVDAANAFKEASASLAKASLGTTVIE